MRRTALLLCAGIFASPVLAQEQVYLYVSYKDAAGVSYRHKLDCVDAQCKVDIKTRESRTRLSDAQRKALLEALQAEAIRFAVEADVAAGENLMKVKFRYDAPRKRLSIERRLPAEKPADLTPEMLQVIEAHLDLDLSKPVAAGAEEEKASVPSGNPPGAD